MDQQSLAGGATVTHLKPADAPLEIHDLTVAYHKKPVLWGIDLIVPRGKLVGIVGPNGAGKSTLIKAAMGLLPLSSGWVKIFGQPVEKNLVRVGYVPQRESVDWDFPVNVMDVVLMGRYGRSGLIRRPSKRGSRSRPRVPRQSEDAALREPANLESQRRAAATRVPRTSARPGERLVFHG